MKLTNVISEWASKHSVVMEWLSRLQRQPKRARELWLFCDWAKKTPEQLLALKDDKNNLEADKLLDKFVAEKPIPESMVWTSANTVRSFYSYHYKDLAKKSGVFVAPKVKPYRRLTKESLLQLYRLGASNPRDRSLISFTHSTAIARETLVNLTWAHLEDDWENVDAPHIGVEDKLVKGHGVGKWRGVEQHTFLTDEAKRDLIEYKKWWERRTSIKLKKTDNIFWNVNEPYKPMGYVDLGFQALQMSRRAGVPFSWHDARRYVETALEESAIHPNWARKIRGRKVKGEENPYSRPNIEQLREAFKRAVSYLEFTAEGKPTLSREEIDKVVTMRLFKNLVKDKPDAEERQQQLESLLKKAKTVEEIDEAMKTAATETEEKQKEDKLRKNTLKPPMASKENGEEDCQRIITENDLEKWLSRGWHVQAVLPSGKIVVSNE
jgi:hypothetical protein